MLHLLVLVLVLLPMVTSSRAGIDEGRTAYAHRDYAAALREFVPLALQGHANAQYRLGQMYYTGDGVLSDDAAALQWYRKAAEQGHPNAQNSLGFMYSRGRGVPQDYTQAMIWYRKAAEQGNPLAQFDLAYMYDRGL